MIIIPAIDIKDGQCVRLYKGDFDTVHKVAESPVDTAKKFCSEGAEFLHVVDLDGAKEGIPVNFELISNIAKSVSMPVEMGGGIRDMATVDKYIKAGIARVILGSSALKNPLFVKEAVKKYGDKIAVGIDSKNKMVSIAGWLENSNVNYIEFAKEMESIGVKYIIFTDIDTDGTLAGPNFEQLKELTRAVSCNITASGGIKDLSHIKALCEMGVYGAICGKSIYSGTLELTEAIKTAREMS